MVIEEFNADFWNAHKHPSKLIVTMTDFKIQIMERNHDGTCGDLVLSMVKEGIVMCPYEGVKFKLVPGYDAGYGCPVCKGLSYHIPISAPF